MELAVGLLSPVTLAVSPSHLVGPGGWGAAFSGAPPWEPLAPDDMRRRCALQDHGMSSSCSNCSISSSNAAFSFSADQPLGWLARAGRQAKVNMGDLGTGARTGILDVYGI
jgi:hypothetical protein